MLAALPGRETDVVAVWQDGTVRLGWRGEASTNAGVDEDRAECLSRGEGAAGLAVTASARLDDREALCGRPRHSPPGAPRPVGRRAYPARLPALGFRMSAPLARRLRIRRVGCRTPDPLLRARPHRGEAPLLLRDGERHRLRERRQRRARPAPGVSRRTGRSPRRPPGSPALTGSSARVPSSARYSASHLATCWRSGAARRGLRTSGERAAGSGRRRRLRGGSVPGAVCPGGRGPRPRPASRGSAPERRPRFLERRRPGRPRATAYGTAGAAVLQLAPAARGRRA